MRRILAVVLLLAIGRVASAQEIAVKAGVTVTPDTVRIGDPFRITIGIRAPRGATIEFPRGTDSGSTVESLDPVAVRTSADTTAAEQYADYRVAAWDVGVQRVRLADVIVRLDGRSRRIAMASDSVIVRSLLPRDSAQRVPKPPRPLFESNPFPWWLVALIAGIVALLLFLWWLWRRRRRKPVVVMIDPYERAEKEFARIEGLGLLDAGERGRYVTLMMEAVRDYLAARYAQAPLSLTSTELARSVRDLPHVPQERLARVLTEADLIKFARRAVSTERARQLGAEARAIVHDEHAAATQPASAQGAAA